MTMTNKIHILGPDFGSFLRSVRLYCEELQISYTHGTEIEGKSITLKSNELAKYHPFKKVPVLIHNDTIIFETPTICRYLDAISPKKNLIPTDPVNAAIIDEWTGALSIYIDQILMRQYVLEFAFPQGPNNTIRQHIINQVKPKVIETLTLLDNHLATNDFFCGNAYSMADSILTPMLDYVQKMPNSDQLFTNTHHLLPYLQKMRQRPSGKIVLTPP